MNADKYSVNALKKSLYFL